MCIRATCMEFGGEICMCIRATCMEFGGEICMCIRATCTEFGVRFVCVFEQHVWSLGGDSYVYSSNMYGVWGGDLYVYSSNMYGFWGEICMCIRATCMEFGGRFVCVFEQHVRSLGEDLYVYSSNMYGVWGEICMCIMLLAFCLVVYYHYSNIYPTKQRTRPPQQTTINNLIKQIVLPFVGCVNETKSSGVAVRCFACCNP